MSYSKLVVHFRDRDIFPITIDEITDWLTKNGFQDEIHFYPVDMDPKILRGVMCRYIRHDGVYMEPKFIMEIDYPKTANTCWERMICCKELMHIFDTKAEETKTPQEIIDLTRCLTSPVEPSFGCKPASVNVTLRQHYLSSCEYSQNPTPSSIEEN